MTSEKRAQKFHTYDALLPKSGRCVWLAKKLPQPIRSTTLIWVVTRHLIGYGKFLANQTHLPDLGSVASSVLNFCTRSSDVISQGPQKWRRECRLFSQAKAHAWYFLLAAVASTSSSSSSSVSGSFPLIVVGEEATLSNKITERRLLCAFLCNSQSNLTPEEAILLGHKPFFDGLFGDRVWQNG